ncbi:Transcription factor MYC2, partial [Mucuna pruriens]
MEEDRGVENRKRSWGTRIKQLVYNSIVDWCLVLDDNSSVMEAFMSRAPPLQSQSTLQQLLGTLIEGARESWSYAIFWLSTYDYSGASILRWGDGYYNFYKFEEDKAKGKAPKTTSSSAEQAHRKKVIRELHSLFSEPSASATDDLDEEVPDIEWFFQDSITHSFVNASGLPGHAFFNSGPVWVTGSDRLSELACKRARQGQVSGLRTLVCIPFENGVVELASTKEKSLHERVNTETQNHVNDNLSKQSRGKEKISALNCSWSLLSENSDTFTDSTFSYSHDYSGPSWTHGILWRCSTVNPVLKFHDGYYRGTGKGKEVCIMGSSVTLAEEVTDAQCFFKTSMTQSFGFNEDLPGCAFKDLCPVWINATDTNASVSRLGERYKWGTWERTKRAHQFGIQTFVCIPSAAIWVLELASTQIIPYCPQWLKHMTEYPFAHPLRNDKRLQERANNEIQNQENNKLSKQSRGKEKISDSKCSWPLLTESSDRDTDRTFSCSHDYS